MEKAVYVLYSGYITQAIQEYPTVERENFEKGNFADAPVEAVKVLVNDVGEAVAAEIEDAKARETPERANADVGHLRVRDDEGLQEAEVLEIGAEAQPVLLTLRHRALK